MDLDVTKKFIQDRVANTSNRPMEIVKNPLSNHETNVQSCGTIDERAPFSCAVYMVRPMMYKLIYKSLVAKSSPQ